MTKKSQGNLLLLITAIIWGCAFVAQSSAMDHVGPFTFVALRMLISGLVLIPVIPLFDGLTPKEKLPCPREKAVIRKNSVKSGIVCGIFLCIASCFQQIGICYTTAGKAGFVTALYVIIVPILGIFIHKKIPKIIWFCAAMAVLGFYLLCINEKFDVSRGDIIVLGCAFFFSLHIMVIDYFTAGKTDGVRMSCVQFFTAGFIALVMMILTETPCWEAILEAKWNILYAGVLSGGAGYTMQILGQKHTEPATASLLMSLESVFAALAGWLFLQEVLSLRELAGCLLVFAAVILAQIPLPKRKLS